MGVLVGRSAEWAEISGALEAARSAEGSIVLLRGEAGVGKTALLQRATEELGFRVLRATGVEAESDLGYATAHQLVYPLLELLDQIPDAQAAAVRVALGTDTGGVPDRFLVALGLLSLVSEAAGAMPLLLILDDVQWWDNASLDALLFVARRISAEPVTILMAVRDDGARDDVIASVTRLPGLREVKVGGLPDREVAALMTALAGIEPPEAVTHGLAERTHGNPLALVELIRVLTPDQLTGQEPLPRNLSLGNRLERPFLERAARLSAPARALLLAAAAEPGGDLGVLSGAAGVADVGLVVEEVERVGLAAYDGRRLSFVHPLARSALYADAGVRERCDVHLRLAQALSGRGAEDRAVWHQAAAALGADDDIAEALVAVAERERNRSGHAAAAAAYERAAELSGDKDRQVERLTAAADAAWLAGQPARARLLVDRAEPLAGTPVARGRLVALRARSASRQGDVERAHRLFVSGAQLLSRDAPHEALELLAEAVEAALYAGAVARLAEIGEVASMLHLPEPDERTRFLMAWLAVSEAGMSLAPDRAQHVRAELALVEGLGDPRLTVWAGIAALNLGDIGGMQRHYARALEQAREAGAAASLPYILEHTSMQLALAGSYAACRSAAEEGLRLARESEQDRSAGHLLAILAFLASTTGDAEECRRCADEARAVAGPFGIGLTNAVVSWSLGRLDLATGRHDEALERLTALATATPGEGHPVIALWSTIDLVEAAARARRTDGILEHLGTMAAMARAANEAGSDATAAWCRGLHGGANAAADLGEAAAGFAALGLPVAAARARLVLGELLRRDRQPRAAREHLRAALDTFRSAGAAVWAERAAAELRASGDGVQTQEVDGLASLTAQELQIARYVSQGASNKDIAAQLFLSPRTVEYHLYKAYPKLGVTSRTQLISRFAEPLATAGA